MILLIRFWGDVKNLGWRLYKNGANEIVSPLSAPSLIIYPKQTEKCNVFYPKEVRMGLRDEAYEKLEILKLLIKHEDIRLKPYKDTKGILTIGVGRNLERGISIEEALYLLDNDLEWVIRALKGYDWWEDLNGARKVALMDMMFNLGAKRFAAFRNMIKELRYGDYVAASKEMLDSKWAREVGNRAREDAKIMETGVLR